MAQKDADYSLYLVTDSTPAILGNNDLIAVVKDAIAGGTANPASRSTPSLLTDFRGHDCPIT